MGSSGCPTMSCGTLTLKKNKAIWEEDLPSQLEPKLDSDYQIQRSTSSLAWKGRVANPHIYTTGFFGSGI